MAADEGASTEPASTPADRALPAPTYEQYLEVQEERLVALSLSAIEAGRRKGGVAGAAMAGAMLVVSEIYEGPRKDDKPVTVEASSDPDDVDRDGIDVSVGEVDVSAPALPRLDPVVSRSDAKPPQV
jgi:hypothetical protein